MGSLPYRVRGGGSLNQNYTKNPPYSSLHPGSGIQRLIRDSFLRIARPELSQIQLCWKSSWNFLGHYFHDLTLKPPILLCQARVSISQSFWNGWVACQAKLTNIHFHFFLKIPGLKKDKWVPYPSSPSLPAR